MKAVIRHIFYIAIAALMACSAWACCFDNIPCEPDGTDGDESYRLVMRISPIDVYETAAAGVTERIKSLRVIVMKDAESGSADGGTGSANGGTAAGPKIEYNQLITSEKFKTTAAAGFEYTISLTTTPGKKDIYLIANEESVGEIKYQRADGSASEESNQPASFTAFLNKYVKYSDAAEFREAVGAIYFEPTYTPDAQNALYLPYMSHYKVDVKDNKDGESTEVKDMFLVPVATKFTFKFINKRSDVVTVSRISVESTDTHNFILARVGGNDYEKTFGGTKMYWVDWLAKVAEESHKYPDYSDNMDFNERYGWISDYEIPTASEPGTTEFIGVGASVPVPAQTTVTKDGVETDEPGVVVLGPYYRPESLREKTGGNAVSAEDGKEHEYLLTLDLQDGAGESPEFEGIPINNLHALFRNTSVYITVTMSSGDVEVYAEISGWNRHEANGWVNNGGDDKYVDPDKQSGSGGTR